MRPGSSRSVVQQAAVDLIQSLGAVAGANRHGADGPARRHLRAWTGRHWAGLCGR